MNTKQSALLVLRWCGSGALLIGCWAGWLTLAALLAVEVWIATHRELAVPAFALHALERRLADSQITARFGRAVFDPNGRFVIENVRLFLPPHPHPVVTVRAAYASVDFWALLAGNFRLRELRLTGVDLFVPAMLSPSGTDEAVVSDLDGVFHLAPPDYDVALCTFRLGGIRVSGHGRIHLPPAARPRRSPTPMLDLVLQRSLAVGRQLVALRPRLEGLQGPRVDLVLTPAEDEGALVHAELFADAFRGATPVRLTKAQAQADFPLLGSTAQPVRLSFATDQAEWSGRGQIRQLRVDLTGSLVPDRLAFAPLAARLVAAGGDAMTIPFDSPCLDVDLTGYPRVQGDLRVRAAGSAFAVTGEAEIKAHRGAFTLDGSLTPPMLAYARQLGLAAARWIAFEAPARLHARVILDPGWKPARAEADMSIGHVVAHEVTIDAARAHAVYADHRLEVSDLLLLQGDNAARGSYTMDTITRDYRFLLSGRLRPVDISGWFKAWWPRFWAHFDFTAAPPMADVDVTGRWRDPARSTIFCFADADRAGIRGVSFDRVRTTLFIRPYFYHVNEFEVQQAGRSARGSFTLTFDRAQATYRTLDFDVASNLALTEWAQLYGPAGAAMVAPYRFAAPPIVNAVGHLDGPSSPDGPHARANVVLTSDGALTVYDMPLDSARATGDYRDGHLDLHSVEAVFAGGTVTGRARFDGLPKAGVLAFDASLTGADLARAINALGDFERARGPASTVRSTNRLFRRASGGRLDLTLAAEGQYRQPLSFHGPGTVSITGRELGEIHLFGLLSELLSKTLLNFTSLRLDEAHATFKLEGDKLAFSQVKITGPSAAIDARGDYWLDARTLNFNAKVFPLQQSGFVLTGALGLLLTPLSNVLELKLTGPLQKPSWAFLFGPTSLLRSLTRPAGETSAAPAAAGTAPAPPPAGTPVPPSSESPAPAPGAPPPAVPSSDPAK